MALETKLRKRSNRDRVFTLPGRYYQGVHEGNDTDSEHQYSEARNDAKLRRYSFLSFLSRSSSYIGT